MSCNFLKQKHRRRAGRQRCQQQKQQQNESIFENLVPANACKCVSVFQYFSLRSSFNAINMSAKQKKKKRENMNRKA